jgi:hypothetical protein
MSDILKPANEPHALKTVDHCKMLSTMIHDRQDSVESHRRW